MSNFFVENGKIYVYDSAEDKWTQYNRATTSLFDVLKPLYDRQPISYPKSIDFSSESNSNNKVETPDNLYISFLEPEVIGFLPDYIVSNLTTDTVCCGDDNDEIIILEDFNIVIKDSDNIKLHFRESELLLLINAIGKTSGSIMTVELFYTVIINQVLLAKNLLQYRFDKRTRIFNDKNKHTVFGDLTVHYYIDNKLHKLTLPLSELKILD